MHVNGVTQPVVYIPTQVIAPSVPSDHPISLPTADKSADPTPGGTPFVSSEVPKDHSAGAGKEPAAKSAMVEPPTSRPKIVTQPVEQAQQQPHAPHGVRGFDEYA